MNGTCYGVLVVILGPRKNCNEFCSQTFIYPLHWCSLLIFPTEQLAWANKETTNWQYFASFKEKNKNNYKRHNYGHFSYVNDNNKINNNLHTERQLEKDENSDENRELKDELGQKVKDTFNNIIGKSTFSNVREVNNFGGKTVKR